MSTEDAERPSTIPQLVHQVAVRAPKRILYCRRAGEDWGRITAASHWSAVRRLAQALHERGVSKGDRALIAFSVCWEWEVAHHACLLLGAVVAGIDERNGESQIASLAQRIHAKVLFVEQPLAGMPAGQFVIVRDSAAEVGGSTILTWSSALLSVELQECKGWLNKLSSDDLATLLLTSGTTGEPSILPYSHSQLLYAIEQTVAALPRPSAGARFMCWMSLAAWFQRLVNLSVLSTAGTIFIVEQPRDALRFMSEIHPTAFVGVPRVFEKIYETFQREVSSRSLPARLLIGAAFRLGKRASRSRQQQRRMPLILALLLFLADRLALTRFRQVFGNRLEYAVVGSAPTPRYILDFFHSLGLPLLEAYGVSENALAIAINRLNDFRLGSVGRPLSGQDVRVSGEGEVLVRGPGVCTSITKDDRITPDGFYRTGDNGYIDADGYLFLAGRQSSVIKTSTGRRIVPEKIEALLSQCPDVEHVMIIGEGRKYLVALVTLSDSAVMRTEQVAERISEAFRRLQRDGTEWEIVQKVIVMPADDALAMNIEGVVTSQVVGRGKTLRWLRGVGELTNDSCLVPRWLSHFAQTLSSPMKPTRGLHIHPSIAADTSSRPRRRTKAPHATLASSAARSRSSRNATLKWDTRPTMNAECDTVSGTFSLMQRLLLSNGGLGCLVL